LHEVGVETAGNPGNNTAEGEGEDLPAHHLNAQARGRVLVLPDGHEEQTDARAQDQPHDQQTGDKQCQEAVIVGGSLRGLEQPHRREAQAAPSDLVLGSDRDSDDLGKGDRGERKVGAVQTQAQAPDGQPDNSRDQAGERN
jgi:hypothetical protein